jgi:translation initiation factor 1
MNDDKYRLVYSTDRDIPKKEPLQSRSPGETKNNGQKKITVRLDRKKRAGKSVTLIEGLPLPAVKMEALLRQIKAELGTGGTMKDGALEIQGDHCDAIAAQLERIGYKVSGKRPSGQ